MSTPVQLVRRYPISAFAVLACLFGWMPYVLAALGHRDQPREHAAGPGDGRPGRHVLPGPRGALRAWGRSLRRWAASPWLYALAVGAPIVLHVSIVLVNHLLGAPLPTARPARRLARGPGDLPGHAGLGRSGRGGRVDARSPRPSCCAASACSGRSRVLAPLRILWHLPLMITGDMPLVVGILGNAGFQLVVLLLLRHRRGSWTLAAVWHATLNAFGGAFFFAMVTGADRDRLDLLLGLDYALVGVVALVSATHLLVGPWPTRAPSRCWPSTRSRHPPAERRYNAHSPWQLQLEAHVRGDVAEPRVQPVRVRALLVARELDQRTPPPLGLVASSRGEGLAPSPAVALVTGGPGRPRPAPAKRLVVRARG